MKLFCLLLMAMTIGCIAAHAQMNVGSNTAYNGSLLAEVAALIFHRLKYSYSAHYNAAAEWLEVKPIF